MKTVSTGGGNCPPLRPEAELLLCCARNEVDSENARRIRELLKKNLDWEYLLKAALRHGLMPLLYRNLTHTCPDLLPPEHLSRLRDLFRQNAARNLLLNAELGRILRLFERHGITAMPYKGPALALSLYGELALRQFSDLDILVRQRDVFSAEELLIGLGYEPHFSISESQRTPFLRLSYVQLFSRDEGRSLVELHWNIAPRNFTFPLDVESLWERLVPLDLGGVRTRVPTPEDLLLILCVHGVKDLWERLEWICGVAELVRLHPSLNWERVVAHAARLGSERMLWVGLRLAHDLLGAELPPEVLRKIRGERELDRLKGQVLERLFAADERLPSLTERVLFHLRARERWRDRARYCVRLAMTSTPVDWSFVPLPNSLTFIYPLLRPFRLVKKYGPGN